LLDQNKGKNTEEGSRKKSKEEGEGERIQENNGLKKDKGYKIQEMEIIKENKHKQEERRIREGKKK
jgi:hypothetical protein